MKFYLQYLIGLAIIITLGLFFMYQGYSFGSKIDNYPSKSENSSNIPYPLVYDKINIGMTGYEFNKMIQTETSLFASPTTSTEITFNDNGWVVKVYLSSGLFIQQSENSFVINNLANVTRVELYKNNTLIRQKG